MPRPPFDMMRACFWLLAIVIAVQLFQMLASGIGCGVLVVLRMQPVGTCVEKGIIDQLRETWSEIFTAVLALLLAARSQGPPPPPPPDDEKS